MLYDEWVGIEEADGGGYSAYPNPSSGAFTVTYPARAGQVDMRITDMLGRSHHAATVDGGLGSITLAPALAEGMYLLTVHDGSGQRLWHSRIIIVAE